MRKGAESKEEFRGDELALLEGEKVDWEKIWNRSVMGDALPSSLRELRYVFVPTQHSKSSASPRGVYNSDRRTYTRS